MESWGVTKDDAIWATEDEYTRWNKKSRLNSNSNSNSNSTSKAIGRMFYKTKLCCKYRSGTCPYVTNCNFAHGLDELRNPPENWQEIVAAHDEEQHQNQNHNHNNNNHSEQQQQQQHLQQIPIISTTESRGESHHSQRSYKGRHCKKFYTQEGCPYGDSCTFLHDEQSRSRESVAISVTPALAPPSAVVVGGGSASSSSVNVNSVKPSNWKTRICNKWETTGTCPFGPKCHFAHGWPELHNFGMATEGDCRESPAATETKTAAGMAIKTDAAPTASLEHHHHNHHHVGGGITSQRPSMVIKVVGRRPHPKWKGPDKISRIYGDWIGDIE